MKLKSVLTADNLILRAWCKDTHAFWYPDQAMHIFWREYRKDPTNYDIQLSIGEHTDDGEEIFYAPKDESFFF
jgi:hypothetical protein